MTSPSTRAKRNDPLDAAFVRLQDLLPAGPAGVLRWLHHPKSGFVRIPLGILCIIGSFFSFLPVLGVELLPIGVLLVAQDVPFLRAPVGRMTLRLIAGASRLRRWWKAWRAR